MANDTEDPRPSGAQPGPGPDPVGPGSDPFALPGSAPSEERTQIAPPIGRGGDDDQTRFGGSIPGTDAGDDRPPPSAAPPAGTVIAAPATAWQRGPAIVAPGTLINNNYEVQELISAGGMGEVYRGINPLTGDMVAIKIVLQSLAHDEKIATLFRREARVLCQLSDQAIVRYYNFVHDAELDRFCLIMEFIDGITLLDHARTVAPLTAAQAKGLLRRLALGLDQAHRREVIHRDLSPDNVILRGGLVEDAVLIDFGIAKSSELAESTLHGQLAGKFKYISPEQLGSFGGEIGPRTDIYSLALLIAAALRGEPIDMGSSIHEAVHNRQHIPDLSDIPDELRPILSHMLEPDPALRPARMPDVVAMLDDPALIPPHYGAVVPMPFGLGSGGGQGAGLAMPPGPLQRPPGAAVTGSGSGLGIGSPVGSHPPGLSIPPLQPSLTATPGRKAARGGAGGAVRFLVIMALLGGGGYYAYSQGMLDQVLARTGLVTDPLAGNDFAPEAGPPDEALSGTDSPATGTPLTREGFLAASETGPCTYATRVVAGADAGMIAGFATGPGAFEALPGQYEDAFSARPAVTEKRVTDAQCPVLDLARLVQAGPGVPPVLTLDSAVMPPGGSIVGRLSDRRGRPVWLVLVTGSGAVFNLTPLLAEQADGSATFSFGLDPGANGDAAEHLILALASDAPLVSAAAAPDGVPAATLMPLIEAEIAGRQDRTGAALAQFTLAE
ncbi:MAG: serine/threonine protein kinase [Rubellimicrobium sp.]|nr:serine/threonine protein kinase [Rubellimicrobium sp.]